ncbi:MAG: HAD family hydrolase [Cyanophyceae cyanobacterium]
MTTVIFWDIDGTLLTTAKAGVLALEKAAGELFGTALDLSDLKMAGGIDRAIAATILQSAGRSPTPETIEQLLRLYGEYLPDSLKLRQGFVFQGVREILEALRHRTDVLSILLTGNIEAGARAKLAYYGLDSYFTVGAFADYAESRSAIARQALKLAEEMIGESTVERRFLLGDTPQDIQCGQAIDARVMALASGSYSQQQLQQHHPWLTLPHLPEPAEFFTLLDL